MASRFFDGVDDLGGLTNQSNNFDENGSYSFMAWFAVTATNQMAIVSYSSGGAINPFVMLDVNQASVGKVRYSTRTNDATQNLDCGYAAGSGNDGKWHHVCGVKIGNTGMLYLDGFLVSTSHNLTGLTTITVNTGTIGALRRNTNTLFISGRVNGVKLFAVPLEESEIRQEMHLPGSRNIQGRMVSLVPLHGFGTVEMDYSADNTDKDSGLAGTTFSFASPPISGMFVAECPMTSMVC